MEPRTLAEILAEPDEPIVRAEVRNREPRQPMSGHKWHLIHERDGGHCWSCGVRVAKGHGEVDHLIPRSSFDVVDLRVADRSDNLRLACVPCNQDKSNYVIPWAPTGSTVGVTAACWDCVYVEAVERPEMTVPAYCGRCGHTWVPGVSWLM